MGDFLVENKNGELLYRIKNIQEMIEVLELAGENTQKALNLRNILEDYGKRDCISTWLYMHSFRELGDVLRPIRVEGQRMITVLKRYLKREVLRMASTPLYIDNEKANNLTELVHLLKMADPRKIQRLSNNDVFSSWLDRKGYTELAEELRPIHGTGQTLIESLSSIVEKWAHIYDEKKSN
jgi:hypothetical protein